MWQFKSSRGPSDPGKCQWPVDSGTINPHRTRKARCRTNLIGCPRKRAFTPSSGTQPSNQSIPPSPDNTDATSASPHLESGHVPMPPASDTVMNSDDANLRHVHVSAAQQHFCFDAISCHTLHNVPCLPSLAWCRNLIPGQHNDGSPSRVRLLGGSQYLQPSRRILAPNTRKLPRPACSPNPRRTGRRQQEWASKQRPKSETGSSLQDAMRDSSGEKPRSGHGTNLERSKNALELPGTASEGSQKGP